MFRALPRSEAGTYECNELVTCAKGEKAAAKLRPFLYTMYMRLYFSLILFLVPITSSAAVLDASTNSVFLANEFEKPATLTLDGNGGFYGYTETGLQYTQKPITNTFGVKLHKFTIADEFFYMTDQGRIDAPDDLTATSIYLSRT
ncbi:MAG: hypothetical protein ACI9VM_000508 [Candidatus Azotimanducaceae bacterium]|jgi:hypothetical protein